MGSLADFHFHGNWALHGLRASNVRLQDYGDYGRVALVTLLWHLKLKYFSLPSWRKLWRRCIYLVRLALFKKSGPSLGVLHVIAGCAVGILLHCLTLAESPARGPGIVINGLKQATFKELRESARVTPVKSVEPLSFEETIHICAHFCTLSANPIFCLLFFALRRLTLDRNFYTWPKNTPERFIKNSWMMLNS